jgi:serine/threonine protein kinase
MSGERESDFLKVYRFVKGEGGNFLCYGSGGFGAVFACQKLDGSVTKQLCVKVICTNEAAAKRMFEREFMELIRLRPLIEADPEARATIILPEDAYISSLSSGGLIIYLVMEASGVAKPFPFKAAPEEEMPNLVSMRSMKSMGSGADLTDNEVCRPPMTQNQARHVIRQVLQAVKFFHAHGLVHRDLKVCC